LTTPRDSSTGIEDKQTNDILFGAEDRAAVDRRDETSLEVVHSLDDAVKWCERRGEESAFVIGGAQIYAIALPVADEMLITHVDMPGIDGDAFFPEWNVGEWRDAGVADETFPTARRYVRR
jgi:dihydrofolate reductase